MNPTIKVRYSCHTCGLTKVSCLVPARGEEDVVSWMNSTVALLSADHRNRSPTCVPIDGQLHDVMIPIESDKVGGAVRQ